jgi:DNA-binding MarR family transcriptional regulator
MLTQKNAEFLRPSTKHRTLGILQALSEDPSLSQGELGRRAGLSSGRINGYLRELKNMGLLDIRPVNAKCFEYLLTEDGERRRRQLLGSYCAEVVRGYTAIKQLVRERTAFLLEQGLNRLVLYGASETCEVVLSSLEPTPFTILALVDSDTEKHGQTLCGRVILPPSVLGQINCDALLITSFGLADEIFHTAARILNSETVPIIKL